MIDQTLLEQTNQIQYYIDQLSNAGFIVTTQAEMNKTAIVIMVAGMVTGIVMTLLFQYFRRKTKDRMEALAVEEMKQWKKEHGEDSYK